MFHQPEFETFCCQERRERDENLSSLCISISVLDLSLPSPPLFLPLPLSPFPPFLYPLPSVPPPPPPTPTLSLPLPLSSLPPLQKNTIQIKSQVLPSATIGGSTFSDDSHRVIGDHLTVREVLDVAEGYTIPVPVLVGEER